MNGLMLSNVRSVSAALAFTVAANSVTSVPVDNGDSQILNNIYLADTLKRDNEKMMFFGYMNRVGSLLHYDGWTEYSKMAFRYDDDIYLEMREPLMIRQKQGEVAIRQWDVELQCTESLDKVIIRYFQMLYEKAKNNRLDGGDFEKWLAVLGTIEYEKFSRDVASALYEEFDVRSITNEHVVLIRQDGHRDMMNPSIVFRNGRIEAGDKIGGWVKRDHDGNIVKMYDIRHLEKSDCLALWEALKTNGTADH